MRTFLVTGSIWICAWLLTSCDSQPASLRPGARLLPSFNYAQVTRLSLVKNNPRQADRWSAEFTRDPLSRAGQRSWLIREAGGQELLDRRAQGNLIEKLLDTLSTTRFAAVAPPATEDAYGLTPPRFALRWTVPAPDGTDRIFELALGEALGRQGVFARARFEGAPSGTFVADGALIEMLARLNGLRSLRLAAWSGHETDEVDELEIRPAHAAQRRAERQGSEWKIAGSRPAAARKASRELMTTATSPRSSIDEWLDTVLNVPVADFIDDPLEARSLETRLAKRPDYELVLRDRQGRATRLRVAKLERAGRPVVIGDATSRPGAPFELPSEALEFLKRMP